MDSLESIASCDSEFCLISKLNNQMKDYELTSLKVCLVILNNVLYFMCFH